MISRMAHQQVVCVFTVLIILLSKGCRSQQPACGRSLINNRIIGGEDASPGSWPWHATIEYLGTIFCQGSLINNQWVLTAARCSLWYNFSDSVVHLGMQSRTGFNPNEVTRTIDSFIIHEGFDYNYDNDICLVKLSDPVNFTDFIQPVCLASENSTFYDGTTSWVTGFGYNLSWYQPNTLQEIEVQVVGNDKCICLYENYFFSTEYSISESTICAGSENEMDGASYGDQGAALVTRNGSVWIQSGIASYTNGIYFSKPGVYTRVSQYQQWISDKLNGTEPGFDTFTSIASDSDFNYTCLPSPPFTPPTFVEYDKPLSTTAPPSVRITTGTTTPAPNTDGYVFSCGVKLNHIISLSALAVFLHFSL